MNHLDIAKAFLFSALLLVGVATQTRAADGLTVEQALAAVRTVKDSDRDHSCSAVVVAPGRAVTAAHCAPHAAFVEDVAVSIVTVMRTQDIAVLTVPGLECPCAPMEFTPPAKGEKVVVIGRRQYTTAVRMTKPGRVVGTGLHRDVFPREPRIGDTWPVFLTNTWTWFTPALTENGDSGGGTFAVRKDGLHYVAVNSVGVNRPGQSKEYTSGSVPLSVCDICRP